MRPRHDVVELKAGALPAAPAHLRRMDAGPAVAPEHRVLDPARDAPRPSGRGAASGGPPLLRGVAQAQVEGEHLADDILEPPERVLMPEQGPRALEVEQQGVVGGEGE